MSEENNKETPPPVEPPPAEAPPPASTRDGELEELRRRLDDVEVKADAALLMHLEDDVDDQVAEPERTEVEARTEPKAEEKKEEAPPAEPAKERHSGMFL